jgi:hypothetical protein
MNKMTELRRGIYRIENPHSEDEVQVRDVNGGAEMPISESLYRSRRYDPPVEDLPTREQFYAEKR